MKKKLFLYIIFFCSAAFNSEVFSSQNFITGDNVTVNAGKITYNTKEETFHAHNNVTAFTAGETIKGDNIFIDQKNEILSITGNAFIETDTETINGDSIFLNYKTKKGVIRSGKIFIKEVNFYLKGEKIEKESEKTYIAEKASFTACDNPKKDWEFKAEKIKATIDGYGYAWNMNFNTMDRPLLYLPFMYFPVKTKRQSGLLVPEISYSSADGAEINQPLYLVLSDQADMTLYYHFMEKRSDRTGIEFRIQPDQKSFTQIFYDQINNDPYLYNEKSQNDPEKKPEDRYWFRMKSDYDSFWGFKTYLDLDIASDPDYLNEFDSGYLGFDETEDSFSKNFNRNIEPEDDTGRTNRFLMQKNFTPGSFEAEFLWIDDLIIKETDKKNNTVHRLPRLSFYSPRSDFSWLPVQASFDTEYNYFHRIYGEKGHRVNFTPTIYAPFQISNYLSVEPSAYFHETLWYTKDRKDDNSESKDYSRQIYGFNIKTSTSFFKVFNVNSSTTEKIKHTITPSVNYSYTPDQEEDQQDLPDFDDFDRIEHEKRIEFSLDQTLTSKSIIPGTGDEKKYGYKELLRFELTQPYNMDESQFSNDDKSSGRFEDLEGYLKVSPIDNVYAELDAKWSHYDHLISQRNLLLRAVTENGSEFGFEHRYTHEENESLRLSSDIKLSPKWRIHGFYEKILMENKKTKNNYEKEIGAELSSQCWTADLVYNETEDEKTVTLYLNLMNLGGIDQSISDDE
ncbi:MAG: LPS-assembly protein LptD [Thermodesulfobacteriota bacterium]